MGIRIGSWGTPELGITEAIGSLFGANRTDQGGSNIRGSIQSIPQSQQNLQAQQNLFSNQSAGAGITNPLRTTNTGGGAGGQVLGLTTGTNTNTNNAFIGPNLNDISSGMTNQINSGWDSYTNQLNDILNNNLPDQRGAQESLALNAYNTGVNRLGQQKTTSERHVAKQQASSLKDLSSNVQNLFNAGNTYLGARGAADSSAANQYSYAISKMGSKARGDIQAQAGERLAQIGDIYNSELNRLESEKTQQMDSISQWFNEQQTALKQQLGQAGLNRSQYLQEASQTLYNQALQMLNNFQTDLSNRRSALEQWALNNSNTVQEAVSNLQSLAQLPQYQGIQGGMPTISSEGQPNLFGFGAFGGNTDERKGIFG